MPTHLEMTNMCFGITRGVFQSAFSRHQNILSTSVISDLEKVSFFEGMKYFNRLFMSRLRCALL